MISEADLNLIDQYINNELDADQKTGIEERLANDQEFATQYELVKAMPKAILTDPDALRSDLQSIMMEETSTQNIEKPKKAKQVSLLRILLSAAAIFAGITLAINLLSPTENADLYSLNFSIPEENITTRQSAETHTDLLASLEAYNRQNYGPAIEAFQKYLSQHPQETASRFFLSISLMQQKRFEEARTNLELIMDQSSPYQNSAHWYLALTYLQLDQIELAKNQLDKVTATNNSYTEKARDLLEQLP